MISHTHKLPTDANIRRHLRELRRRKSAVERLIRSLEAYQRDFRPEDSPTRRAA